MTHKPEHTHTSTQATMCAGCGEHKHTPLRIDAMGGYVCLTCIDQKLGSLLGEFGYPESEKPAPVQQEPEYIQLRHKEEDGFSPWGQPLDPKYRNDKWAADVEMRLLYTAPQPAPVQGWKLVPVDPTIQMCLAGAKAADSNDGAAENAYYAMLAAASQATQQQEPVRIYDYVWPQRDEHKEECVYACSYTPGHHLARGELLAVVHPSQLKNAYLQRDGEAAHGIKENT